MIARSPRIILFLLAGSLFAVPLISHGAPILVLGDSISAAYGLENPAEGWVNLLQDALKRAGRTEPVVNASISGETSAGGLARVDALLEQHAPGLLILELGANDGLRGLPPSRMQANLDEILTRAERRGARTLLLGMRIPPNYGKRYNDLFEAVFPALARAHGSVFVPFLLEGVGGNGQLMQADGLHPNRAAQPILFKQVWDRLESLLPEDAASGRKASRESGPAKPAAL